MKVREIKTKKKQLQKLTKMDGFHPMSFFYNEIRMIERQKVK